jgi:TP901 family phage tail tape measure protein
LALSIGELTGYLDLDAGPFEKAIGKAFDSMGSKKWQVAGAAAGVAAGTALAAGLVSAADTQKLNNKMSASLGLTKDQSATAGKAAGQLYADNYGSSMEDVTGAVEGVMSSIKGMRTASQSDIQDVTKDVLNLASAFEVDTGRAAQVTGQMITSGIATDAKNATDLLAGTLSKVPKEVRGDIIDAVDEYAPFMATLGIKGEEAMGILATSSEKGMYGIDKTGDALKEFTIRSTDMSTATGTAYKALGMNQKDMSAKLLAGGDTAKQAFGQIIAGLQTMDDPVAQSQAALALFGTPLEDLSVTEIPKFLGSIDPMGDKFDSLKGKAGELDTTLSDGAANGWTKFQRGAETAMSSIGAQVLPILQPIIDNLGQWAPVVGPAVLALAAFAGVIWAVSAAMAAYAAVKGIIDAIKAWTVVQWLLNTAMFANPITWIILGIVALIAIIILLVANWDNVVAFLQGAWAGFVGWFQGIMDGFLSWWGGVWDGFIGFLSDAWNNAVNWFNDLPRLIGEFFVNAGNWLFDAGKNIVQGLFDGIKSLAGTIGNFFLSLLPGWIVEPFKLALGIHSPSRVFKGLGQNIGQGLLDGVDGMQGKIDGTMSGLVTVPDVPPITPSLLPASAQAPARATAPGAEGERAGFVQKNYFTTPDDHEAIADKVWGRFQQRAKIAGVRV